MANYIEKLNNNIIGGNNFDGQWVYKYQSVYSGYPSSGATLTYSLSSYLPNDGYDYEILLRGYGYTGTTSGNTIQIKVNSGSTATHSSSCLLSHKITRTSNFNEGGCTAIIPIKNTDKNISILFAGNYRTSSNQTSVQLFGYRRVGANSIGSSNYIENIKIPSSSLIPNAIVYGSPTITNGVVSDFSASNYLDVIGGKYNNNAEYVVKFTIGNAQSSLSQTIFHSEYLFTVDMTANSWVIKTYNWQTGSDVTLFTSTANTTYWVKTVINGQTKTYSYSTDGENYTQVVSFTDTSVDVTANYPLRIGNCSRNDLLNRPFTGSIDLNETYINVNGERVWDGMDYINNLVFGGNFISGQWKSVNFGTIYSGTYTADTVYTVNLKTSNLIPNDNYQYELLLSTWADTGTTSGNYCIVRLNSNLINQDLGINGAVTRASSTNSNGTIAVYPIASDGILKVTFHAPSGIKQSGRVWLHGYRRLGTNE